MANYVRCCAGCSGTIIIQYETARFAPVYCGKCKAANEASWADFDPQPYPARDRTIRRWSGQAPVGRLGDTNREWCVLAREGDWLTVRPLGLPDTESVQIPLSDARPRSDRRWL